MELIERSGLLASLHKKFQEIDDGEGHCIFLSGEAGIGKTSVVKAFCRELKNSSNIYQGTCDALFTPRPLAPLFDILLQLHDDLPTKMDVTDRTAFFTHVFHDLKNKKTTFLIVFEDIHWADEATLDFIKFLARRITQLKCFFILTYRDNEIYLRHPLRNVLGQLKNDSFTRIQLSPLSKDAVEKMALEKGYSGEDVYSISAGNPFYVNEILASYSPGIPDNIKDSILSVYNRQDEQTKNIWKILSVLPTGFEMRYLEKIEPQYEAAIEQSLDSKILLIKEGIVSFKHELYRRTIEASLSPLLRIALNKKILELFCREFAANGQIERIIHHSKNANEYDTVVRYAPAAARIAASVGAHVEAARLYCTTIEYYQGSDKDVLLQFYEPYAYECYLTNQMKSAIIYTGRALNIWKEKNNIEKTGNCLRFLSRLWWFEGKGMQAESFAKQAIEVLDGQPSSTAKAMAYSNMSQLKMLADQLDECLYWGDKAIAIAREINDEETLCHALNNIGAIQMRILSTKEKGAVLLNQSLEIALSNSFHEHAARAYTNLSSCALMLKDYALAEQIVKKGLQYCEERDLDSWTAYISSRQAILNVETGHWNEAIAQANNLLKTEGQSNVIRIGALTVLATIKLRKGDADAFIFLTELKKSAFDTAELQRIIPALSAMLEYEWLHGKNCIDQADLDLTLEMITRSNGSFEFNEFAFWLNKARNQSLSFIELNERYDLDSAEKALSAAACWEKAGNPYYEAIALSAATDDDKRKALTIIQTLGATAVCEKLKQEMRSNGIRNIPRGIRKATQANPALLTDRELDVLRLLNEGMPNKQIAAELFISAKTVDHHISSILFKLDAGSRVQAVQEAVRLGIVK